MPAPQNNQGFVAPRSGGTGNWIGKLFGGIGDNYRARSMAQLQLELHGERAKIDTENIKERATHKAVVDAAAKDYLGDSVYKRSGKEMNRAIKKAPSLKEAEILSFDSSGKPVMQATGLKDRGKNTQTGAATPEGEKPTKSRSTSKTGRSSGTAAAPKAPVTKSPRRARPTKGGGTY